MSLDGVLSVSDVHFWRQSSDHVIGTLHVQVAPSISEQKTCHMIVQFLRDRSLIPATIQLEKPSFTQSSSLTSYIDSYHRKTHPQLYVDFGPHAIKNV